MLKLISLWATLMAPDGSIHQLKTDQSFETMEQCQAFERQEDHAAETALLGGNTRRVRGQTGIDYVVLDTYCVAEGQRA